MNKSTITRLAGLVKGATSAFPTFGLPSPASAFRSLASCLFFASAAVAQTPVPSPAPAEVANVVLSGSTIYELAGDLAYDQKTFFTGTTTGVFAPYLEFRGATGEESISFNSSGGTTGYISIWGDSQAEIVFRNLGEVSILNRADLATQGDIIYLDSFGSTGSGSASLIFDNIKRDVTISGNGQSNYIQSAVSLSAWGSDGSAYLGFTNIGGRVIVSDNSLSRTALFLSNLDIYGPMVPGSIMRSIIEFSGIGGGVTLTNNKRSGLIFIENYYSFDGDRESRVVFSDIKQGVTIAGNERSGGGVAYIMNRRGRIAVEFDNIEGGISIQGNKATSSNGGAFYLVASNDSLVPGMNDGNGLFSMSNITGDINITDNQANRYGGFMYAGFIQDNVFSIDGVRGNVYFLRNTTASVGGAMYLTTSVGTLDFSIANVSGNIEFRDNMATEAGGLGGALTLVAGGAGNIKFLLSADGGDIIFSGNKHQGGMAGSFYAQGPSSADFRARDGKGVYFYDPFYFENTSTAEYAHVVDINKSDGVTEYTGTVALSGAMLASPTEDDLLSVVKGDTNIHNGTFLIEKGAMYYSGTFGSMNIGATGSLAIRDLSFIEVDHFVQVGNLAVDISTSDTAAVFATTATIGAGATLSVTSHTDMPANMAKASLITTGGTRIFIETTEGIIGAYDRANVTINGYSLGLLPDYLVGGVFKSADNLTYNVGPLELAWHHGTVDGHGGFTLANAADTFEVDIALTDQDHLGAFITGWDGKSLTKLGLGTLVLSAANTHTGTTFVRSGTLALRNLHGLGSGDVQNDASLALGITGTLANNITGSGTTYVSYASHGARVVLTGTNDTNWHIAAAGVAQVSLTANLGAGNTHIDGLLDIDASGPWEYANALSGSGALRVNTGGAGFSFTPGALATSDAFTGTLALGHTTYTLAGDNTRVLANATLLADGNSLVTVGSGTQQTGNLTLDGGRMDFATGVPADITSPAFVSTGTLTLNSGTIAVNRPALGGAEPAAPQLPLLQQDEGLIGTRLASADAIAGNAQNLDLIDAATGETLTQTTAASINQNGQAVATGTYDYGLTTGASDDGLYVSYQLKALDIHDGKTLTFAQDVTDPAKGDDMDAKITGAGNLAINATGAITLNRENTYTGTTFVNTGTLIAGADNALGATTLLDLATGAALDLDGHAQTIGAIATASTSILNLNSGSLAIQAGGTIDGNLTGAGALTLSGGTLSITTANNDFSAATQIDARATARLTDAAGLGSADIALQGVLRIANATDGVLQNTLAGSGTLVKSAAGALRLDSSNPGFDGAAAIDGGRLVATQIDALGTAAITVSATATFEQKGIAGTLQNTLAGPGTHLVTSGTLVIADAPAYAIRNTTLDQGGALILADDNIRFGTLRMNNGALIFAADSAPASARIDTLGNTTGNFVLNAALTPTGAIADHLDIGDSGSGAHNVFINLLADLPAAATNIAVELITTGSGGARFIMANPGRKLENGLTTLELVNGDGTPLTPNPAAWYLSDRNLSHTADAILNTASTLALDWAAALDALHMRMGDARAENLPAPDSSRAKGTGNLWLRARGYRLNAGNELSGLSFKQYGWGATAGADKAFSTKSGANLLGAFIDMGGVDRQFDNAGTGETRSAGIGAYATLLHGGGWFIDGIARLDRYSNEFEARAVDGRVTRGKYTAKSQGLSIEAGRRLQRAGGWWLEPGVQMAVLWLNGANYSTQADASQRAIDVRVGDSETWQYRALARFGRRLPGTKWHPYGKFALVAVDSSGGEVTARNKTFRTDYDGRRVELGLGTMYRINDISQMYLDYEYATASNYERPWSLNLGYRRLW